MGIRFQKYNILESSTVTVSSEDSSYPKYRLYDRDIGLFFKSQSYTGDFIVHIDQGSDTKKVYSLIIPAGHNLNAIECSLEYSDDDSSWSTAITFTPPDTEQIVWDLGSRLDYRYWRLVFSSLSNYTVQIPEIVLLDYFTLDDPIIGHTEKKERNYVRLESNSGKSFFFEKGGVRRQWSFDFLAFSDSERQYILDFISNIESGRPFYFYWDEELLKNPGFEDSTNPDWWTRKDSSVSIETTGGNNSNYWMKMIRSGEKLSSYNADSKESTTERYFEVNEGEVYEFGGDVKTDGTCVGFLGITIVDKDKANPTYDYETGSPTTWTSWIHRYTIQGGEKYINFYVGVDTNDGWAGFDNVFLRKNTWTFVELVQDPAFISTQIVNNPWKVSLDLREVLA